MDQNKLDALAGHVQTLRQEAETLAREATAFPAIWRNASKALASIRMMELTLGLEASTIVGQVGVGPAAGAPVDQ